jgi:ATP-dependent RNA helicase DDX46/PRP5
MNEDEDFEAKKKDDPVYAMDREKEKERKREAKKDLTSKVTQEQVNINKNLYIESTEITNMTDEEVKKYRKSNGDIKVRGLNCPKPIKNWYQCGLPLQIIDLIEKKKFEHPFPIQCQSIPVGMSGRDLIGIAETGSGKTMAYVLPMIRHIRDQPPI